MKDALRRSLVGFVAGALLFVGLGIYLNRQIGAGVLAHSGPVAILAVIGGTVGGLVAPLFRRRPREGAGPPRGGRPEGRRRSGGLEEDGARTRRGAAG